MQRTLFSSRPPSSVTRPPYGYSRGTEGLSMTKAYWTAKPNPTNPRKASVNWRSATFGGTTGASGPHIEMTSSVSCSCCKEFQSFGEERKKIILDNRRKRDTHRFSKVPAHLGVFPSSRRPTLLRDEGNVRVIFGRHVVALFDDGYGRGVGAQWRYAPRA